MYVKIIIGDDMKKNINKESNFKNYIIVVILYIIVIILTVLLILRIKNQKDIVKNGLEDIINVKEENIKEEAKTEKSPTMEENINKNNNSYDYQDELNILDQM